MRAIPNTLVLLTCLSLVGTLVAQPQVSGRTTSGARPDLAPLLEALRDTVPTNRARAVNGIADLKDVGDSAALAVLSLALYDPDDDVRLYSRSALPHFPQSAAALAGALRAASTDPAPGIRAHAANALGKVASISDRALPILIALGADTTAAVREGTNEGLEAVERLWPGQFPALVAFFEHCNPVLRYHAGDALVAAGVVAVPPLLAMLELGDWNLRANAARTLGMIGEDHGQVSEALIARMQDPDFRVRAYSIRALEAIGTPAAHTALVERNHGVETHEPANWDVRVGGEAVKPDTSIVAFASTFRLVRKPLERKSSDGRLEAITLREEHRIYVCDVDARTIRVLALLDVPWDQRSGFGSLALGWQGDSVWVRTEGNLVRQRINHHYPSEPRFLLIAPDGSVLTGRAPPKRPATSRGYRDTPAGRRHFLRIHLTDGEVRKSIDHAPEVTVFRTDRETGEMLPVAP